MQTATPGGNRYILTLIDDYSRYTSVYFLKHKHEVFKNLCSYVEETENHFGRRIKAIRSDRGGEYIGDKNQEFLRKRGIVHQLTVSHTPQQNGVAERKNRTLTEMARCMLFDADLHNKYWAEAIRTANYLQNRLPTKAIAHNKTPFELWHGKLPIFDHIKLFFIIIR